MSLSHSEKLFSTNERFHGVVQSLLELALNERVLSAEWGKELALLCQTAQFIHHGDMLLTYRKRDDIVVLRYYNAI